jgi:hypothetical protein
LIPVYGTPLAHQNKNLSENYEFTFLCAKNRRFFAHKKVNPMELRKMLMQTKIFLWGTWLVVLAVYIGFAGAWGALTRQAWRNKTWLSVGFGVLIILPASLALPFIIYARLLAWGAALGIASLFYLEPDKFPVWLWDRRFIRYYFAGIMFLILAWSTSVGEPLAWLWLGLPAGLAGCLTVWKALKVYT